MGNVLLAKIKKIHLHEFFPQIFQNSYLPLMSDYFVEQKLSQQQSQKQPPGGVL